MSDLAESLLLRYRERFTGAPDWAFPLVPSIPFVGRSYSAGTPRIAVYASAENLTHYERGTPMPPFVQGDAAWNRHRLALESGRASFFPYVHIAPVENGSLLCAALYLLQEHLGGLLPATPNDWIERLAVANVGKFSIRTEGTRNRDYAGDRRRLEASLPYFRTDLETLRPDVLMLPRAMFRQLSVRRLVDEVLPSVQVVPVPQFNATVVNVHLARHADRAAALAHRILGTTVAAWTDHLKGYAPGYAYRFYVEIDDILAAAVPPSR